MTALASTREQRLDAALSVAYRAVINTSPGELTEISADDLLLVHDAADCDYMRRTTACAEVERLVADARSSLAMVTESPEAVGELRATVRHLAAVLERMVSQ